MTHAPLGWLGIVRLGLVQTALGAIVVLMNSTINRVMVIEMALPAVVPGALMGWHYAVQISRPYWGHGSDAGGQRTPWIIGGMATLALAGVGAAIATVLIGTNLVLGVALAILSFTLLGIGVGAAGTSLLVLLSTLVAPSRRAGAASLVWIMMIAGFVITAPTAGHFLDPFSPQRLIAVTSVVATLAFLLAVAAVWGVEPRGRAVAQDVAPKTKLDFRAALRETWAEPKARRFTIFIFISMLAYSGQELILEPYAGILFGMTPGATTKLSGVQNGGVLLGMIGVSLLATGIGGPRLGSLRLWTIGGCGASALSLVAIAAGGFVGADYPLRAAVFALGVSNGVFAVAAIGSMMGLTSAAGQEGRAGVRMGVWGASQAVAFGLGGFAGTAAVDIARLSIASPAAAYASVFAGEAVLFLVSAWLASRIDAAGALRGARNEQRRDREAPALGVPA